MSLPFSNQVIIEATPKRAIGSMVAWPGWTRTGKVEEAALDELLAYAERYSTVLGISRKELPEDMSVIDRLEGNATTNFGAPNRIHQVEYEPLELEEMKRQVEILGNCWRYFDQVSDFVSSELKKGPRGGGRDRDKLIGHTVEADRTYARHIGVRTPPFDPLDRQALDRHRHAVSQRLLEMADGKLDPAGWPPRYAIRRMAWHILDHAWEMEDKNLDSVS